MIWWCKIMVLNEQIKNNNLIVYYYDNTIDDIVVFELPTTKPIKSISKINFSTYIIETTEKNFIVSFN